MPFFKPLNEEMMLKRPFYLYSKKYPIMYEEGMIAKDFDDLLAKTYPDTVAEVMLDSFERSGISWNGFAGSDRPVVWPNQIMAYHYGCCFDFAYFMHRVFDYHDIDHVLCFISFVPYNPNSREIDGHVVPLFTMNGKVFIWNYFGFDDKTGKAYYDLNGPFISYKDAAVQSAPYFSVLYQTKRIPKVYPTEERTSYSFYLDGRFLIGLDDACDRNEPLRQGEAMARLRSVSGYMKQGAIYNPIHEDTGISDIIPTNFKKPSIDGIKRFMKAMKSKSVLRKDVGNVHMRINKKRKGLLDR